VETLSDFSHQIFQEILNDDLIMGQIQLPLTSNNEHIKTENMTINDLQFERVDVEDLLMTWSKNIHQMAFDS
ncbi:1102_t:CDS:2, partial [Racocetra persica]